MDKDKMLKSFNEFLVDYVILELPLNLLAEDLLLNESRWVPSGYKDYMLRLDPENPSIPLQRHVHIAQKKHVSAKNKQASWNGDGSIHDRKTFNKQTANQKSVQDIARRALNLPQDTKLEENTVPMGMLIECVDSSKKSFTEPYFL